LLFKEQNIPLSPEIEAYYKKINQDLWKSFEEGNQLVHGALELITDLQDQYDLYIVTNGVSKTQYKRLRASGLYLLFKDIFVSEERALRSQRRNTLIMYLQELLILM